MAASCFGSMWPAWSPPKISRATSPGMTRMITNTRAAAPSSVGMIRSSCFAMYVCIPPGSIFGQPDVLELLIGEVVVDPGIGEATPVARVSRGVPLEEQIGIIDVVERAADDELEASRVPSIREPGGRLERPVLGLDADLAPLLDREDGEVLVGNLDVTVF